MAGCTVYSAHNHNHQSVRVPRASWPRPLWRSPSSAWPVQRSPASVGHTTSSGAQPISVVRGEQAASTPPLEASAAVSIPAAEPLAEQPARFSSLYNWLRYGGLPTRTQPAAAQLEDNSALFGDGMAAVPLAAPGSLSQRSLRFLGRRSAASRQAVAEQAEPQLNTQHPTMHLLRQRLAEGSRPGSRTDGFKLGLVVEGGGMRGCVSGGALQALHDLGMRDVFDAVYGSSAGAINSTYFLSGQREGVEIYHDHIAHPEFIDLKRLWKNEPGAPVLNLTYLIDHVMHNIQPLDWDAVVKSDIPLKVVASSLDSLQPVILENFTCKNDLATCLKASANVPEIAGTPIVHRGQRLVDAAVFEPVPYRSAIADGCTHVLVICTRPKRVRKGVLSPVEDAIEAAIKKAILSPDYMVPAWKAEMEYLAKDGLSYDDMLLTSMDDDSHELPWFAGTHVFPLYPGPAASFSPLCIDVPTLKGGVEEGKRAVMRMARGLLRDVLDVSHREDAHESNIMPLAGELVKSAGRDRRGSKSLLGRYFQ